MISREDALSDVLEALRIKGSVLLHEAYLAPWAVSVPAADALAPLLGAGERNWPVAFHYVERGQCDIALQSGEIATLDAGDLAICFSGQAHRIEAGNPLMTVPVTELMGGGHNPFRPSAQEPRGTSLVCGAFLLDDLRLTPLWSALPPLLHVRCEPGDAPGHWRELTQLLSTELARPTIASSYIKARLLEVLCADAIRRHARASPLATGWLSALRDAVVSKSMILIHQQPGKAWSVEALAQAVALSPSRFAARFTATVGLSPMAYVTAWRMQQAIRLLADGQLTPSRVATQVGYDSAAAFSRAFRRHIGESPSAVRKRTQNGSAVPTEMHRNRGA
jgi:AraC-like DNA-binding protein